jgi:hypothetical protein
MGGVGGMHVCSWIFKSLLFWVSASPASLHVAKQIATTAAAETPNSGQELCGTGLLCCAGWQAALEQV